MQRELQQVPLCGAGGWAGSLSAGSVMGELIEAEEFLIPDQFKLAYDATCRTRDKLMATEHAGCFFCVTIYKPKSIQEWTDDGQAICPVCGIDSVMPVGAEMDNGFVIAMNKYFYGAIVWGRKERGRSS
jgi:hypothetical protein